MELDQGLVTAVASQAEDYREAVAVLRIPARNTIELDRAGLDLGLRFAAHHGMREPKYSIRRKRAQTLIQLPEGASVSVFHASGATAVDRGWSPGTHIISDDADRVDFGALQKQAEEAVRQLELDHSSGPEELRFERLWKLKAAGMTRDGTRGPVALTRVIGAFRRYLHGLPVWGRASVFVEVAADGQVDSAGIDWRPAAETIDQVSIIDPEAAASRAVAELQSNLPGGQLTVEDYEPTMFSLGYFSLPKRRAQTVLQPVWVAKFSPLGRLSRGRLIVIPAAPAGFEPVSRELAEPPRSSIRVEPRGPRLDGVPTAGGFVAKAVDDVGGEISLRGSADILRPPHRSMNAEH